MSDPTARVAQWLADFEHALGVADVEGVVGLFDEDCYWRDLISFTWNIVTLEGRKAIGEMLAARLDDVRPERFAVEGKASLAGDVTEAWFSFETRLGRGRGRLRLKGDRCWTLLSVMMELKGFEEKKGRRRINGAEHGSSKTRQTWLERRAQEAAALGRSEQPYCLIVGGGQGGWACRR
jgi:putative flavoprotein involved in K+ transport